MFIPPALSNHNWVTSSWTTHLQTAFPVKHAIFIEQWYVTGIKKHLGWMKGKGYLACCIANKSVRRRKCRQVEIFTYSVRMPSAVSRPSGVSQNTLAVSLLGSALFSFTLGHWILGGSVSVETNVTEKGTGASTRAVHFLHSSQGNPGTPPAGLLSPGFMWSFYFSPFCEKSWQWSVLCNAEKPN